MKKRKSVLSLLLVLLLIVNAGIISFANSADEIVYVKNHESSIKLEGKTVALDWWDDIKEGADKLLDKAGGWLNNASKDTQKWLEGANKDTLNWLEGANEDTYKWLRGANKDTMKWLEVAIKDIEGFYKDFSKGIKSYRKPQKPKINNSYPQYNEVAYDALNTTFVNVLSKDFGKFTEVKNVKDKKLPTKAEEDMKKALKDIGVSNYWSGFAVNKISGTSEGTSAGAVVESMIPLDFMLGGKVAEMIDDIVAKYGFEDIDFTKHIQPENTIQGMSFTYDTTGLKDISGPAYVQFKGITSVGYRDKIKGEFTAGGKVYPAQAYVDNDVVGFIARVDDVTNLKFRFVNDFKAPANIAFEIADGFQDTVNDISPLGDPISNAARDQLAKFLGDSSAVYDSSKTDKSGNVKNETKQIPSVNELYANGDVGVIIPKAIYQIPLIGDVVGLLFKATGNDVVLENIIRDIFNQKEVNSFIKVENPQLLVSQDAFKAKNYEKDTYNAYVDGEEITSVRYYGTSKEVIKDKVVGVQQLPEPYDSNNYIGQMFLLADKEGNPIKVKFDSTYELLFSAETKGYDGGNTGLVFGVQSAKSGNDQFYGHYLGFYPKLNKVRYGVANYNWSPKGDKDIINTGGSKHLLVVDVKKEDNVHKAYVSIDGKSYGSFDLKDVFEDGYVGVRVWNSTISVYDLKVTSNKHKLKEASEATSVINTEDASGWAVEELLRANKNKLVAKRVASGMKKDITRAEFAALTVKLYEVMTNQISTPLDAGVFLDTEDVDALKAANLGIVEGSNGYFRPNDNVTRQEMAIMYYRALDKVYKFYGKELPKTDGILTIDDKNQVANWASSYVDFVFDNRIITGDNNKFNPLGKASREQAIVVLNRVFEKYLELVVN